MADVKWPAKAVSDTKEDLLLPTQEFLRGLDLMRAEGAKSSAAQTPESVQVVQSGALAVSKWWSGVIAAGSTAGVWVTLRREFADLTPDSKVATILGVAAIIAAAVIAIAVIVRADVMARAIATKSRLQAREGVVVEFLQSAAGFQQPVAALDQIDAMKATMAEMSGEVSALKDAITSAQSEAAASDDVWLKQMYEMLEKDIKLHHDGGSKK